LQSLTQQTVGRGLKDADAIASRTSNASRFLPLAAAAVAVIQPDERRERLLGVPSEMRRALHAVLALGLACAVASQQQQQQQEAAPSSRSGPSAEDGASGGGGGGGRGLHTFPFPLNLSLLCHIPLNLS
jgi:hypothetical protein